MWSLPLDIFSLAREMHMQILNDTGIISEQSNPVGNSIFGMPPTMDRSSRLDKGMEDFLGSGWGGETKR